MTSDQPTNPFVPNREFGTLGDALRGEWPLAAFTFSVPILVALFSTSILTGHTPSLALFVGLSASAGLLSTAHLGKKVQAWRALLNPASSWLSREVLLFSLLVLGGVAYLTFTPTSRPIAWIVFAVGFATLMSIDRVYAALPIIDPRRYHSASALFTGLLLVGLLSANLLVSAVVGAGKLYLYIRRKTDFNRNRKPTRMGLSMIRVSVGFLIPALTWIFLDSDFFPLVIASVLVGELIDRLEFYAELDIVTPEKQTTIDLHDAISSQQKSS
jgi:DMSO reductase anchor subunit